MLMSLTTAILVHWVAHSMEQVFAAWVHIFELAPSSLAFQKCRLSSFSGVSAVAVIQSSRTQSCKIMYRRHQY